MKTTLRCRRIAGISLLLGAASSGVGQTAVTSPNPAADDRTIQLSQFNVEADKVSGYRAGTSITATGIGAKIMDIPIAINVLTKEFLDDAAVSELREALQFVPGIGTTPRNESEYSVRGFTGNISYRNGQYRRQNYTSWNTERVEVLKGPAAIFFGTVRPGGAINYMTTRPVLDRQFIDVTAAVGSEDYYKGGAFINVPVTKTLALRGGAGFLDQHGKAMFDYRRETYIGGSALWKAHPNHQFVLDLEEVHRNNYMRSSRGYAMSRSGYLFNPSVPPTQTARQWLDAQGRRTDPTFDIFAPIYRSDDPYGRFFGYSADSFEKFKSVAIDLEYLGKITDKIAWQTQLNYGFDSQPGLRSNNGDTQPFANGTVQFRFEQFENVRDSYNAKNKLTWKFELGRTSHTLQAGHEYQEVVFNKRGFLDAQNRYNGSLLSNVITFNPRTDPIPGGFASIAASGQTYNVNRKRIEVAEAFYIVNQSRFFNERLHLLYGARNNKLSSEVSYSRPVTNPDTAVGSPKGWTPQFGALIKPSRELSLFAVYSRSIEPNFSIDADGRTAEPIETDGIDVGLKTEFLGGRIASTLTYYTLDRTNLTARDTAREIATGRTPFFIYGNTNTSEGIELDLNLAPVENYQVMLGWSHFIKSEVTESTDPARIGRALTYTPRDTVTLWNRYQFRTGALKGVTVSLGGRHAASARMTGDPNQVMMIPSFTVVDAMVARNFTVLNRNVRAQLNVKNLFDRDYREGSLGMFAPERTIILSASTRF